MKELQGKTGVLGLDLPQQAGELKQGSDLHIIRAIVWSEENHLRLRVKQLICGSLNVSPLTETIALLWGSDPCFSSPTHWGLVLLTLLFPPWVPLFYRVLHGSIYYFPLVRYSCPLSAGVLNALLCLKVYSWYICGERCTPRPPSPPPSCSPILPTFWWLVLQWFPPLQPKGPTPVLLGGLGSASQLCSPEDSIGW